MQITSASQKVTVLYQILMPYLLNSHLTSTAKAYYSFSGGSTSNIFEIILTKFYQCFQGTSQECYCHPAATQTPGSKT